jgi:hypothetical protein
MVTQGEERHRDGPCNNLDTVKRLAAEGSLVYVGEDVQKDVDKIGLDDEGVCARLQTLELSHYDCSIKYGKFPVWLDVYLIAGLYVKLKLDKNCLNVALHSFHPEKYL